MPKSTPASKSSRTRLIFESLLAGAAASAVCWGALQWFLARGYLLYYGDAVAHVNIARRLIDSRTPDYEQIGTVWLPLPHWIMAGLASNDEWWRSGLAGAIPAAVCTAVAALLMFLAARRLWDSSAAGFTALLVFLANPNLLYLGSIPMTEAFHLVSLVATLYFLSVAKDNGSLAASSAAGLAACAGTLIRYDSWFLLPFAAFYLLLAAPKRRWACALIFTLLAAAGPVYWLLHNLYLYGDPLEFYRGPYSAKAIYQRALDARMARYPGDHDWSNAWLYFREAVRLVAGTPLTLLGLAGVAVCLWRRRFWPLAFLGLVPLFYVLSMYSSGTPIFVPHLWPSSYYNTRYGLAGFPLLCFAAAGLVTVFSGLRRLAAVAIVAGVAVSPWLIDQQPERWVCWKESEVNSEARRAWTREAADYLRANYKGGGILTSFGDLTGIFQQAGIDLAETLHEGNSVYWLAEVARPQLFLRQEWVVVMAGDRIATAIVNTQRLGPRYDCVKMIAVKGAPVIEIYRRGSQAKLPFQESEESGASGSNSVP